MRYALIILVLTITSCRLTDHSENAGAIDTDLINIPVSGYEAIDPEKLPRFEFEQMEIDAGEISQGTSITKQFNFRNTGGSPLLITDVRSTCGCTVSKNWPKEPVPPEEGGSIEVTFDSEGKNGLQIKPVTIVANTSPEATVLTFKGKVLAPETENK